MILDVGCGSKPCGTVNVDLFSKKFADPSKHHVLSPKEIRNFVFADASSLPFRFDVFDVVHSRHVIEHVEKPLKMLRELIRVSRGKIIVVTPHRFGHQTKYHINFLLEHGLKNC